MDKENRLTQAIVLFAVAGMLLGGTSLDAQERDDENDELLEEIVVLGTPPERYASGETDSLTGFPLSFLEMPRIVETIPEQLLLDQKITDLNDALRNVPGISNSDGFGGTNDDFFMRGFRRNTVYRDGLKRRSNFKTNTTNIERIEIVKGPASIGFGQVEPGGLVNIVTKKPLDEARTYVELRGGSWNDYLALFDISRPITDTFSLRLNASLHDSESFRDFTEIARNTVAATGEISLSEATSLNVSAEYRDEGRPLDRGTIAVPVPGGTLAIVDTPRSRRFGEAFEAFDTVFQFYSVELDHTWANDWRLRAAVAFEVSDSDDIQVRPRSIRVYDQSIQFNNGFFVGPPAATEAVYDDPSDQIWISRRVDGSQDREIESNYVNVLLTGSLETGTVGHQLAISAAYRDDEETRFFGLNSNTNGVTTPLFDINNPIYGQLTPGFARGFDTATDTQDIGFAVQDYVRFNDRFSALIGARLDVIDADGSGPLDEENELSPQVGLIFSMTPTVSLFASYAEAFEPNTALSVDLDGNVSMSDPFPPEDSQQIEFGVKAQFYDGKLNLSAAVYDLDKTNVVQGRGAEAILIDGQTSEGFEVALSGQPVPGMNLMAGYAYVDAKAPNGTTPRNVAENTLNGWLSYEFQSGQLAGLGFGVGVFYSSDRYGNNGNTWDLGSYTLVDASIWYNLPFSFVGRDESLPTRIQLSGKNLADEVYYPASGFDNGQRINIGTPRSWFLSVTSYW